MIHMQAEIVIFFFIYLHHSIELDFFKLINLQQFVNKGKCFSYFCKLKADGFNSFNGFHLNLHSFKIINNFITFSIIAKKILQKSTFKNLILPYKISQIQWGLEAAPNRLKSHYF